MKKISYVFPGQGSQAIGMGKSFYDNSIKAKEIFEQASDRLSIDFSKLLFDENYKDADLGKTQFTQPAILLVSSLAHVLFEDKYNISAQFALGHSLGEFSALVSVGALDIVDALEVVHKRGLFMQEACEHLGEEAGMMVVLGLDDKLLEDLVLAKRENGKKIWCANYNNDGQIVLAGIKSHLQESIDDIKTKGAKRAMLLDMSVASHCPLLEPASQRLEELLALYIKDFNAPVISNATALPYDNKAEAIKVLRQQLVSPVLYKQSIQVHNDVDLFIEFGHGTVLKGLNKKLTQIPTVNINTYDALENISDYL